MKKFLLIIGLFLGLTICLTGCSKLGDSGYPNTFVLATNASTTVLATTTRIMATNGVRQFASICNNGDYIVYLQFGPTSSVAALNTGYRLATSSCLTLTGGTIYLGPISGIAAATNTVTTIEK